MAVRFDYNRRGGLTVDRDSLHESEGYKRQVEALKQLSDGEAVMGEKMTPCAECGMPCEPGEYHPYAACLMFKGCHNSTTVRANLTQPAQAVDVARASAVHAAVGAIYFNDGSDYLPALWTVVRYLAPDIMDELSSKPADVWHRTMAEVDRLTAALPNANGKEG